MISIFNKLKPIIEITIVYLLWIILHFIIGNLYSTYCVEYSFYGFITSPFVSITPHCKAFRWIIYNSGMVIENMWIYIATYLSIKITTYMYFK